MTKRGKTGEDTSKSDGTSPANPDDISLPVYLTNAIADVLRNQVDKCDYKQLVQVMMHLIS